MQKLCFIFLFALILIIATKTQPAFAQTLNLTILDPTISFADRDPDLLPPSITATPNPVRISVRVRNNAGNNWRLTHQASGDLSSSIPISNISWTVTPQPPFVNGSMSRLAPQTAAQGVGNVNPAITGRFIFTIANLWSYNTGNFSQTTTFTLSAP